MKREIVGLIASALATICGGLFLAVVIVSTVSHMVPTKPIIITIGHAR